jgi:two-component system sensor histidine kinase TctE
VSSSISRQLIFWLAVPLMLLALGGALVHYFSNVAPGVIGSDHRLREATGALMAHVRVDAGIAGLDLAGSPPLPRTETIAWAVRDAHGRLVAGDARVAGAAPNDANAEVFSLGRFEGRIVRMLTTRFDTRAGVLILSAADLHPPTEPEARFGLMGTLLWDFVQLDITLVLVWVGIQLGLRPVKRLRDEIARRSPLDLRPIDESSVPREIAPVVITLNRLFALLRTSVQSQQQFIANTAHQLRTPITGMQAQLELLAAEPAAAPVRHRLATLQEAIRQLGHSANQLLTLARADPAVNIAAKNQTVQLDVIVREVVGRFIDRALGAGIDLGADVKSVSIEADPSLIDDLLSNLVDNALKYTPAGGAVTVTVDTLDGKATLIVEDTGPGIPAGERERVRQRFYRLPNSPGHGSGLGLAIVDEIARIYGATLTIDAGRNAIGTKVFVEFP